MTIALVVICISALIMFITCLLRLNNLYIRHAPAEFWNIIEVIGLATMLAASAGIIGEQFFPKTDFKHSGTLFVIGCAVTILGVSKGKLSTAMARLQGWDGFNRRVR